MKRLRNRPSVPRTRQRLGPGLEMLECRRMFSVNYMEQDQVFSFEELPGPDVGAQFGTAVAVDGDTMVVGGYLEDLPGKIDAGSAHVYTRNDNSTPLNSNDDFWQLQDRLIASDAAADDQFGTSVAISGDTIVVGSNYDDHGGRPDAGAAYVFTRDGDRWSERAKLTSSHAAENDRFGNSVSIHDETIVVGSIGDDHTGGSAAGSAYVFTHTGGNWSQTTKLTASDARAFDQFGASVAVSGDTIVVGSRWDDYDRGLFLAPLNNAGSAYVFTLSGGSWSEQAKLTAADPAHEAIFGGDVSIANETIVVGSVGDEHAGFSSGSAYVFARLGNSWSQQAKLTASDAEVFDRFGGAVAISGETIVVGSSGADTAYVFRRSGDSWSEQSKLTASDATTGDSFGNSVSISGDTIVVGSRWDDVDDEGNTLSDAGSIYVFSLDGAVWSERNHLVAFAETRLAPEAFTQFGNAVAVDGDTMVIGSSGDWFGNPTIGYAGAAFVFTRNDASTPLNASDDFWQPEARLTASDAVPGDNFGVSVSISGDTIVVGNSEDQSSGSVYVFTRSGGSWGQQAKLIASDAPGPGPLSAARFGSSVSISGDSIVVGSFTDSHLGQNDVGPTLIAAGSAYVFTRSDSRWNEQAKLIASDAAGRDYFGASVSISGDSIVVTSREDDHAGVAGSGSAYVFTRSGTKWSEQAKLTASDATNFDFLGDSVSISADTIVVGSSRDDHEGGKDSGSAYVFTRTNGSWSQQAKLTASDAAANDSFGVSVSIRGETIVVGSISDDHSGDSGSGSAYVFTRIGGNWSQTAQLTASDAGAVHQFGASVAVSGDTIVVGSLRDLVHDGQNYISAGSAYVFVPSVSGDSNGDGLLNCADVDALVAAIVEGNNPPQFDLTGDEIVDSADLDEWLILAGSENLPSGQAFSPGDANLDGKVDAIDLNAAGLNWRQGVSGWCSGDFTADGVVNASDLNALAINWRNDVSGEAAAAVVGARAPRAPLANRVAAATTASSQDSMIVTTASKLTLSPDVEYSFDAKRSRYDATRIRRDSVRGNEALAQIESNEVKIVDELFARL